MSEQAPKKGSFPTLTLLGAAGLAYALFLRPRLLTWGTQLGEAERDLPGDDVIPSPGMQFTRALDIDAPPQAVYPWLVQMGREGTGFYSLDFYNNNGIPSANYLRHDLEPLLVGTKLDNGLKVIKVETQRWLLYGGFHLRHPFSGVYDMTSLYLLEPRANNKTRLLVRTRSDATGIGGMFYHFLREPLDFLLSLSQFTNLGELAQSTKHLYTVPENANGNLKGKNP